MKLIFFILLALFTLNVFSQELPKVESESFLNRDEIRYLKENRNITIATMKDWVPYDINNEYNQHIGFHNDMIKIINKHLSSNLILIPFDSWKEAYKAVTSAEVNAITSLSWTKEREKNIFEYSPAYHFTSYQVIVKENSPLSSITDLKNKILAIREKSITLTIAKEKIPSSNIKMFSSVDTIYKSIQNGQSDATIISSIDNEILKRYGLKIAMELFHTSGELHIGINKDYPIVASIIKKGINTITIKEMSDLKEKWFENYMKKSDTKLDTKEFIIHGEKEDLEVTDILPLKEILIGFVLLLGLFYLIWKYQIKSSGKDFALKGTLFIIITAFLVLASVVTILTINNIEKAQKNEIKESLRTVLTSSYKTIKLWIDSQYKMMDIVIDSQKISKLVKNNNIKGLDEHFQIYKKVFENSNYYLLSKESKILSSNLKSFREIYLLKKLKEILSQREDFNKNILIPYKNKNHSQKNMLFIKVIQDNNKDTVAYLVIEIDPQKEFIKILQNGRMGTSGETYAFNESLQMISNSRFDKQLKEIGILQKNTSSFLNIEIKQKNKRPTQLAQNALEKSSGININGYKNYRDIDVYGAWIWDDELKIAFATEIEQHEAMGAFINMKKTICIIVFSIVLFSIFLTVLIAWITTQSKKSLELKVEERTKEIDEQRKYTNAIMDSQNNIVISTDGLRLKTVNRAFFDFFGVKSEKEFIESLGNCICDTFDDDPSSEYVQKMMGDQKWIDYIYTRPNDIHKVLIKKDGIKNIFSISVDKFSFGQDKLQTAVLTNITELESIRKNIEMILSNIMLPVLITSKKSRKILYANEYASIQYEIQVDKLIGNSIDTVYTNIDQKDEIIQKINTNGCVENLEERYRTNSGKEFTALLSVKPIKYQNEEAYIGMVVDITQQKELQKEMETIHKHTQESIEYASLIQHALIPSNEFFGKYFSDYFTLWHPKDIVGGDIYLFQELRDENECILMVIDCTGHGVPGAFVTMLVKAIERQVTSNILNSEDEVSPAKILSIFNINMKYLLKQDNQDSISNAGFDGGILYYNKEKKIVKFAGAETPLFYIEDSELKTIKGSRQSVGYKKSKPDFEFKEHTIEVKKGMQFYLTTDGYLDQNGGEKGFPFGKRRFSKIIEENHTLSFEKQQEVLLSELMDYQESEERNDDVTVIGIKI